MPETMHCYRHPKRETRVTCSTCDRPICTECMNTTPVGVKCPDDARLPRRARAGVMKPEQIAKTFLAGLAVALIGVPFVLFLLFNLPFQWLIAAAAGYGAGTLVLRAGGRNGGSLSVAVSAVAVLVAFAPVLVPPILAGVAPNAFLTAIIAAVAAGIAGRGR